MNENDIEVYCLEQLGSQGWKPIDCYEVKSLRGDNLTNVVLDSVFKDSLSRINPSISLSSIDYVVNRLKNIEGGDIIDRNKVFCQYLREGIKVESLNTDRNGNEISYQTVKIFDFDNIGNNSYICTNQFTVSCDRETKRMDIVLIINGLPVVVLELKNPVDENATVEMAFNQLQTYKATIPTLFTYNSLLIASDGILATMGSLTADYDRFLAWKLPKSNDGNIAIDSLAKQESFELDVLIKELLQPEVVMDMIANFTVFEQIEKDRNGIKSLSYAKKIAAYHQYYAVNKAIDSTLKARLTDKKAGVIWHTQGSGKSLSMLYYAGKIIKCMNNPTLVIITDRNDLDQQLFDTFANSSSILGQTPIQATSRDNLKTLLTTSGGGVVFTTIQKFEEGRNCLSNRDNIIVIADEAHRSQYGFNARENVNKEVVYGYAQYLHDALPNASYIGFTGTPIDATKGVFGEYIDIYDIAMAVEDKATVPIQYQSRVIKFDITEEEKIKLDAAVEEVVDGVEDELAQALKRKGLNLELIIGNPDRIQKVAIDMVEHFEERQKILDGKAMIVCTSRAVAIDMLKAIQLIRPDWYNQDISKGKIKVVMSDLESSSPNYIKWQEYLTKKPDRQQLSKRLKDPNDELQIVIVVDMWLTGFDAPCLHTLYIDKMMKTHNLMQAIARVNRVFGNKPGGLIIDYIGIATKLREATKMYTNNGGTGDVQTNQDATLNALEDSFTIVAQMLYGLDYSNYLLSKSIPEKLQLLRDYTDHILSLKDGKKRYLDNLTKFKSAVAITSPHPRSIELSKDLLVFESIKSVIQKLTTTTSSYIQLTKVYAIRQLVDQSLETGEVINIFDATGIKEPALGILSDEFLNDIRNLPQKHLATEALKKLLDDNVKSRSKINIIQSRKFSEQLTSIINKYHNNFLTSTEVIEKLIDLAHELRDTDRQAANQGLTEYEMAFYDALKQNKSAEEVLSDEQLGSLAKALVLEINSNSKIDWANRSDSQAKIRLVIKGLLKKYNYPPDMEKLAVDRILEQTKITFENS